MKNGERKRFGFLSNLMDTNTLIDRAPHLVNGIDVTDVGAVEQKLLTLDPFIFPCIGGATPSGQLVEGYFGFTPLTARQMIELPMQTVIDKVVQGVNLMSKAKCSIVGLGSLTGSGLTGGGLLCARHTMQPMTTGNTFAAVTTCDAFTKVLAIQGADLNNKKISVIGATGSIGGAVARELATLVERSTVLSVAARNTSRLDALANELRESSVASVEVCTDINESLSGADYVIVTTAAESELINENSPLKSGVWIIDDTKPRNTSASLEHRKDVKVIDGGLIDATAMTFSMDMDCPRNTIYACLVETAILNLEGHLLNDYLGRVDHQRFPGMREMAKKYGFKLAPFHSFGKPIE